MTHRQAHATWMARTGVLALALTLSVSAAHAREPMLAAPAPEQALWYQAYDQGVKAALAGNWALAIPALEVARRGGPAPGRRVAFQGDRVDVFNPDYYLGLAYNATRRYAEAEAAFARVTSAGLVRQGDREFEELRKQTARATYERTLQDGDRAVSAGRFTEAEKALQALVGTLADDGRAGKLVERAREALTTGSVAQQAPPTYTTPEPQPNVQQTVQQTVPPANAPIANTVQPPPNLPLSPPPTGNTATPAAKAPDPKNAANIVKAPNPPANVRVDPRQTTPRQSPIVESLVEADGMAAYFQGNYDGAVSLLQTAFVVDPPSARVAFYLACSKVARAILAGGLDQATTDEARRMFTYAAGDSAQFAADRAFISPAVLRALGSTAPRTERRAATAS